MKPESRPQLLMRLRSLPTPPSDWAVPAGCSLRTASPADAESLTDLLAAAFPEVGWTHESARRALIDAPDVPEVYVVERGDMLLATASVRIGAERFPGSGYLHWVGVRPEARGLGLGRLVTERVLGRFRELGCRDSVLETDDFRIPAISLYLRLGYEPEYSDEPTRLRWASILARLGERQHE